jgi:hypothetical protein
METHKQLLLLLFYFFYFASFLYSLKPYFFFLFFKTLLLFYSLKSQILDLHCPTFPLNSNITPKVSALRFADTQQQLPSLQAANQYTPSAVFLYTVANEEVEQQFWQGMIL